MRRYVKRTILTLTAAACIAGGSGSALAAQQLDIIPINAPVINDVMPQTKLDLMRIYGTATSIENGRIVLENNNENADFSKIVLNISENTLILDAVSGMPTSIDDIRDNEFLYAYISPAVTKSLPPIANPEVILTSIPADFAVPSYVEIDRVEQGETGSVIVHTNEDKSYTVTDETELFPYLTFNLINKNDLMPGTKLLVWQQTAMAEGTVEAASAPAKMMVFPYSYSGYVELNQDGISINGTALELEEGEQPYADNGRLMVPFRKTVEALGYEIKWDNDTRGIQVVKGDTKLYSFTARGTEVSQGEDTYTLHEAAALSNGVSFIALEDLIYLNDAKLAK